jgi:hypothetical protein
METLKGLKEGDGITAQLRKWALPSGEDPFAFGEAAGSHTRLDVSGCCRRCGSGFAMPMIIATRR